MVIDDDRAFEDRGVLADELNEFGDLHRIEVDVLFLDDLRTGGDDVIGPVLAFGDDLQDVVRGEIRAEDILRLIGDFLVIEPFFDFAAAGAAWRNVDFDHCADIIRACTLKTSIIFRLAL